MNDPPNIIKREKKMVNAMVKIFCKNHHSSKNSICPKCFDLKKYANNRLENCRYQEKKPVCGRCGLKCYNNQFKEYAMEVFNYSGPRMFFHHPILGFQHICDAFRNNEKLEKNDQ